MHPQDGQLARNGSTGTVMAVERRRPRRYRLGWFSGWKLDLLIRTTPVISTASFERALTPSLGVEANGPPPRQPRKCSRPPIVPYSPRNAPRLVSARDPGMNARPDPPGRRQPPPRIHMTDRKN
jgi:hypothetical protein